MIRIMIRIIRIRIILMLFSVALPKPTRCWVMYIIIFTPWGRCQTMLEWFDKMGQQSMDVLAVNDTGSVDKYTSATAVVALYI